MRKVTAHVAGYVIFTGAVGVGAEREASAGRQRLECRLQKFIECMVTEIARHKADLECTGRVLGVAVAPPACA